MTITQPHHQPAHWIAGESVAVVTIDNDRHTHNMLWYNSEWLTEGELTVMVRNQLTSGMVFEAEHSAWALNAVQVYDEWFSRATRQ